MKAALIYTALRLLVLVVVGGVGYLAGLRGLALLLVAFVGSGAVSVFLLSGPRTEFGRSVGGYFSRLNQRIDDAARAEDATDAGIDMNDRGGAAPLSGGPAEPTGQETSLDTR